MQSPVAHDTPILSKEDLDSLGLSVHWLKTSLAKEVGGAGFDEHAKVYDIEPTIIRRKGAELMCPVSNKLGCSYTHALFVSQNEEERAAVGQAKFMLSYAWEYKVKDIIDTLSQYCESNNLDPKDAYVWICCFCVNQHRVQEKRAAGLAVGFQEFEDVFYRRVTGIGHILSMMTPWDKPGYLERVWCIFELFSATIRGCKLDIVLPPREHESLKRAMLISQTQVTSALAATDIEAAKASVENDRKSIMELVQKSIGSHELNVVVNRHIRGWIQCGLQQMLESGENTTGLMTFGKTFALGIEGRLDGSGPQIIKKKKQDPIHEKNMKLVQLWTKTGEAKQEQGQYAEAAYLHHEALALCISTVGELRQETANCYANLGAVAFSTGNNKVAAMMLEKCRQIRETILVWGHPGLAHVYNGLGLVYSNLSKPTEALKYFEKCMSLSRPNRPSTATLYNNMGMLFKDLNDHTKALEFLEKAKRVRESLFGPNSSVTAISYNNLGTLYCDQNQYDKAVEMFRKSLQARESVLDVHHPKTALTCENLGFALKGMGDMEGALEHFSKALAAYESNGTQHSSDAAVKVRKAMQSIVE